ncbi:MAG: PAS domain S-box protein [Deltaproteobacteria bacterium]|nr:PAS domain S-box protein [Deltaproteobacteria bacterium]
MIRRLERKPASRRWSPERLVTIQQELGYVLSKADTPSEALDACLASALEATGFEAGGIYLDDPEGGLRLASVNGIPEAIAQRLAHSAAGSDRVRLVMKGQPCYFAGTGQIVNFLDREIAAEGFRCIAVVPIRNRDRIVGCLNVASWTKTRITKSCRNALDITVIRIAGVLSRFQAEKALWESESLFRDLMENSLAGVYLIQDGRFAYVNPHMAEMLGYTVAELTGKVSPATVVYADDWPLVQENLRRRMTGETNSLNYEFRVVTKNGEVRYAEVRDSRTVYKDRPAVIGTLVDITERKRADEALRESESKFRTLVENSVAGVYLIQNGRFEYVNAKLAESMGYTVAEVIGKTRLEEVIHPEDLPIVRENLRRRLAGEIEAQNYGFRIITKSGKVRHVEVYSSLTLYRGEPAAIGTLIDITERRQAEQALRESEEKFRTLFESGNDAILIMDDRAIIDCNRKALEMFGCTRREEIVGKWPLDFSPPRQPDGSDSRAESARRMQLTKEGNLQPFEWEHLRCDRTRFLTEVTMNTFELHGIQLGQAIIRDVTERKRSEESLIRLSTAIEQAAEAIIIMDRRMAIEYVNPAFERMTGYSRTEVFGRNLELLKSNVHDEAFYRNIWKTIRKGEIWTGRLTSRCKDGRLLQEEATITPILNSAGELTGYIELKRDITEEVKLETQLRQGQKMEAIGTLAGGIAHDFNNILSAILGYTEMALGMLDGEDPVRSHLEQVFRAGERARDLVKQILAFSRQGKAERRPLRVSPIVKEVLKLLRASLPATLKIQQEIQDGPDTILGDPTHIHQILMNLCTNAAHAMQGKKGTLKVTLAAKEITPGRAGAPIDLPAGCYLKLVVSDTGVGIDPLIIDRIFDPFFTTKKPGEGTGMGLAAVYGIVTDLGGKVVVKSRLGKGTDVAVFLPRIDDAERGLQPEETYAVPGGKECILFIDDEKTLAELGREMLRRLGYEVVIRTSALEALELFRARPGRFDLLVTDMTMPDLTGIELAQECFKIRPGLPILLCTGFNESVTAKAVREARIREVILKPIVRRRIAEAIRRALDSDPWR